MRRGKENKKARTQESYKFGSVLWPGTLEGNLWHYHTVFYCTNKILLCPFPQ